jgi:hypothetical protein
MEIYAAVSGAECFNTFVALTPILNSVTFDGSS